MTRALVEGLSRESDLPAIITSQKFIDLVPCTAPIFIAG